VQYGNDFKHIFRMDIVTPHERSIIMSRVRSKDSRPEMLVRKMIFKLGYRYRLHAKELPGCPDLVFRKFRKVIFVHGCFWHRHEGCSLARLPKSRRGFWVPKLEGNRQRDHRNLKCLARENWKVLTLWECQIKKLEYIESIVTRFLDA
jgi:DNA mismatch endonuclease (patch repair protein)